MVRKRLTEITNQIFLLEGDNKGRFPNAHSILILGEETVLIDTGCGIEVLQQLTKEHEITYVINSHTHPDHSAGNWIFAGKPIVVPEEGFSTSGNLVALSERFVNKQLAPYWRQFATEIIGLKDCPPTNSFNEEHPFKFGETTLNPIYTPGHTNDHYCFFDEREGILFSFDYDLTSFPWYGHRESSLPKFRKSINLLKDLHPKVVVSSHRGIITENLKAEFEQFSLRIDERDDRLLELLETEKTLDQLVELAPIYGKFPYRAQLLRYWEGQMIKKHLEELLKEKRVHKRKNRYIRN